MGQQLRAHSVFVKDPSLILRSHVRNLNTALNFSSRSDAPVASLGTLYPYIHTMPTVASVGPYAHIHIPCCVCACAPPPHS